MILHDGFMVHTASDTVLGKLRAVSGSFAGGGTFEFQQPCGQPFGSVF